MKQLILILSFFYYSSIALNAQVIMKDYLQEDHSGLLSDSRVLDGEPVEYRFTHERTEAAQIWYRLQMGATNAPLLDCRVKLRNLITTFYMEVKLVQREEQDLKTLSVIYDKGNKWARIKFAPHEGCKREGVYWQRLNDTRSFQQLLEYVIRSMDENVDLDCYSVKSQ